MRIITISREFGSGGRELGKRLAEHLNIPCYDKEIIAEVAKLQGISASHVERISQADARKVYAATIGRSFGSSLYQNTQAMQFLAAQEEVIRKLASQGDCVIVGQNADVLLKEFHPMNVFVYADQEAKLRRCLDHIRPGETEKDIRAQMKRIDKARASNRRLLSDLPWGSRESYHLCINTSGRELKALVPALAEFTRVWFV